MDIELLAFERSHPLGEPAAFPNVRAVAAAGASADEFGAVRDDFERDVYCLLGLPLDAMVIGQAVDHLHSAIGQRRRCFMSTPNLNFLIASRTEVAFRESVVNSDLSVADGMPLVMMARMLSIPIRRRVAGSAVFERMMAEGTGPAGPVKVFFFGGQEGVAEAACRRLEKLGPGGKCVGASYPGFGTLDDMSGEDAIARINASGADFLVVSLGAHKGQAWIEWNRDRLDVPVISHLGAVVNFVAGTIERAPVWMQRRGAEWLWRIREEPGLWRRYWRDGIALLALVFGKLLPLLAWKWLDPAARKGGGHARAEPGRQETRLVLAGAFADPVAPDVRRQFRLAAAAGRDIVVDCTAASFFGPGLFGLLIMLRKRQSAVSRRLRYVGVSPRLYRLFCLNGADYLLE